MQNTNTTPQQLHKYAFLQKPFTPVSTQACARLIQVDTTHVRIHDSLARSTCAFPALCPDAEWIRIFPSCCFTVQLYGRRRVAPTRCPTRILLLVTLSTARHSLLCSKYANTLDPPCNVPANSCARTNPHAHSQCTTNREKMGITASVLCTLAAGSWTKS